MNKIENKNRINILAPAKVNLTLNVIGLRDDGYHELSSVMHSINLYDEIELKKNDSDKINCFCLEPLPENNTAVSAARLYMRKTGCSAVDIRINKQIPSRAGLGGASADAAGVLVGMNKLFGHLDEKELFEIGRQVGADVPFCLFGGCALAQGIGEKLTRYEPKDLTLLLVKGSSGISTASLFKKYDEMTSKTDLFERNSEFNNDLMSAAIEVVPEIEKYRMRMLALGASASMMTGSGSVVYGVFATEDDAKRAYDRFEDCTFKYIARTIPSAVKVVE